MSDTSSAELLESKDLPTRCEGVRALARESGERGVQQLVALLSESSWYLRATVVETLVELPGAEEPLLSVLEKGQWYERASACDALARVGESSSIRPLLRQLEDRNVSVQKSAVEALRHVAQRAGLKHVAAAVATLPPETRRRFLARVGHQAPHWIFELRQELERIPAELFATASAPKASQPAPVRDKAPAVARFRRWLLSQSPGSVLR